MYEVSFRYPWGEYHMNLVREVDLASFVNHLDGFADEVVIVHTEN